MGLYDIRIGAISSNYRMDKGSWFDLPHPVGWRDAGRAGDQALGWSFLTRSASHVRGQVTQVSSGRSV